MALLAAIAATPARAHVLAAGGTGFVEGLAHPLSGLDHSLAMVAVGVWSALAGPAAWWRLPLAFMVAMACGTLLGALGASVPGMASGAAFSVLALGALIGFAVRTSLSVAIPLVALFGMFHGHLHGSALPQSAAPALYALGFVIATGLLHGVGAAIGWIAAQPAGMLAFRAIGAALSLAGALLIVA